VENTVFRIRKQCFDAIIRGEKTVEYQRASWFWLERCKCTDGARAVTVPFFRD